MLHVLRCSSSCLPWYQAALSITWASPFSELPPISGQQSHWSLLAGRPEVTAALTTCLQNSLVAQLVKPLPAMRETWFPSLGQKDPLEEGMAPHSNILA